MDAVIADAIERQTIEASALEAFEKCGFDPQPEDDLGDWELALWGDFVTVLVSRLKPHAVVVTRDGAGSYTTELLETNRLSFLVDQIHRCQAGALNSMRPVEEVSV